jgi:hypothetical protein
VWAAGLADGHGEATAMRILASSGVVIASAELEPVA